MKTLLGLLLVCSSLMCSGFTTSCTQDRDRIDTSTTVDAPDLQCSYALPVQVVSETGQATALEVTSVGHSPIGHQAQSFACALPPFTSSALEPGRHRVSLRNQVFLSEATNAPNRKDQTLSSGSKQPAYHRHIATGSTANILHVDPGVS